MKGNIRTKGSHRFKYTDEYNTTYNMILTYMFLSFFVETYDERSIRDICMKVPPHIHEWWISMASYHQMCICCSNTRYISEFGRDKYRYSMQEFIR